MKSPEIIAAESAYDASLEAFRQASRTFTAVTLRYRSREIDDAEFLAARKVFNDAMAASDAAETLFIQTCNSQPVS